MTAPQIVMVVYITIVGGCAVVTLHSIGAWALSAFRRRRARKRFEVDLRALNAGVVAQREVVQDRLFGNLDWDGIADTARSFSAGLDNLKGRR